MHVYIECLGDILLKLAGSRYLLVKVNCTMRPLLAGDGAGLVDELSSSNHGLIGVL